jgi:hypothetical protein
MTPDFDSDLPEYPQGAGFQRNSEASKEGARHINARRPTLLAMYHELVLAAGPDGITGDEIAEMTEGEAYLVRPRLTDLKELGKIVSKGERREGAHGVSVTIWVASCFAPEIDRPQGDLFDVAA